MSEVPAVTNQLKINNAAAAARDAKKSQQDQSNADAQRGFFANLAEGLRAGRENVERGLKNIVTVTKKGTLTPTQKKEEGEQQKSLFGKLGDTLSNI